MTYIPLNETSAREALLNLQNMVYGSLEWNQTYHMMQNNRMFRGGEIIYPSSFNYLLILTTLIIIVVILVMYLSCFIYVVKGNLDLPMPGGENHPPKRIYFCSPLPALKKKLGFSSGNDDKVHLTTNMVQPAMRPAKMKTDETQDKDPQDVTIEEF